MPKMLVLPKIGVNMTEAVIVEWLVKEGDSIREGDHIIDAETDKAVQEICANASGVLGRILVKVGEKVSCQDPIAVLLGPGEGMAARPEGKEAPAAAARPRDSSAGPGGAADGTGGSGPTKIAASRVSPMPQAAGGEARLRVSPLARKTATAMGIDWSSLSPARPGARVVRADVLARAASLGGAAKPGSPVLRPATTIPYAGVRRIIGERLGESVRTKPAASLMLRPDAGRLVAWRGDLAKRGIRAGYTEMLVMIVARALKEHPLLNSTLEGDEILLLRDINIGVAVDTERGLLVPVIHRADRKGLRQIGEELAKKAEAARAGRSLVDDLEGGSFTITNLGMYGIEAFTPIINPPECCILGVGAIRREPVVLEDGSVGAAALIRLTLAFDHRIVDGATAARFLQAVKRLVESPMDLLLQAGP